MTEYLTSDRSFATHLFKLGYTNHTIEVRDGVKVWVFSITPAQMKGFPTIKKTFYKAKN